MNIRTARSVVELQEQNLRKIDYRFSHGPYEFRIRYQGGFACYIGIDYREIGKRKYRFFGGVGAYNCTTAKQALQMCFDEINKKLPEYRIEFVDD